MIDAPEEWKAETASPSMLERGGRFRRVTVIGSPAAVPDRSR